MAQAPLKGPPPPRPPSPLSATAKTRDLGRTRALNINRRQCCSIYLLKKLDSNNFKPKQTAAKFSANIIWLLFYLFVKISCLREQPDFRGVVNAAASRRPLQDCRKFWCFPATHKLINYFLLKFFGFQPKAENCFHFKKVGRNISRRRRRWLCRSLSRNCRAQARR